ncbi:MAG: HNH endonuclease [Neisseriaceae bacterium]|nr:HNH endonuclease [Neisseriaceae bacterium]
MSRAFKIKDFPEYYVTDSGDVYSRNDNGFNNNPQGRIKKLKQAVSDRGYKYVRLYKNGVQVGKRVHRLVAETFVENPDKKPEVNHKNGIRWDNRAENLEWMTHIENQRHSWDMLGRVSPKRKLKNKKEYAIKE